MIKRICSKRVNLHCFERVVIERASQNHGLFVDGTLRPCKSITDRFVTSEVSSLELKLANLVLITLSPVDVEKISIVD